MKNVAKEVAYFLNNRPLCFLSIVFSIRDFIIGLGLLWPLSDMTHSLLYANLNELGGAWIFGALLMVISVLTGVAAVADNNKLTRTGLQVGAWFWLFACMSYLMNGNVTFSILFLFLASVPSGYLAFYYKHTPIWDEPKRKWRAQYGLPLDRLTPIK